MRAASLLLGVLLLAGCLEANDTSGPGAGAADPGDEPAGPRPVEPRTLDEGQQSGHREAGRVVLTNESEWEQFWREHREGSGAIDMEATPAPEVDFTSERVVAVTLGSKGSGCWAVRVMGGTTDAGTTTLNVTTYAPNPQMPCTAVVTYPYHFVAVPADGTEIVFAESTQTYPPGETPPTPTQPPVAQPTGTTQSSPPVANRTSQARTLAEGQYSGIEERLREVIETQAEWDALWTRHAARGAAGEQPQVDFERERVVVVFNGQQPDACHNVRVPGVTFSGGPDQEPTTRVTVTTYLPGPGQMCAEVVTSPFVLVAIPQDSGEVAFEERQEKGPAPARSTEG